MGLFHSMTSEGQDVINNINRLNSTQVHMF